VAHTYIYMTFVHIRNSLCKIFTPPSVLKTSSKIKDKVS
jgi:hypothetical protein